MRYIRYQSDGVPQWGVEFDSELYSLSGLSSGPPTISDLGNPGYCSLVERAVEHDLLPQILTSGIQLLAPVQNPGKIICAGLNYADHASEQDREPPDTPALFSKAPSSVTNPGAPIVLPAAGHSIDYEVEIAMIVGRTAFDIDQRVADDYIAGYTLFNDVTARDVVAADGQNFRGKSYPTFAPLGPRLVSPASFNPDNTPLSLRVNGVQKQSSNTENMSMGVAELLEFITRTIRLEPGDIIATGTPAGVGAHRSPPEYLESGDQVTAENPAIGKLENPVIRETR